MRPRFLFDSIEGEGIREEDDEYSEELWRKTMNEIVF
jgi:hypothetical protein